MAPEVHIRVQVAGPKRQFRIAASNQPIAKKTALNQNDLVERGFPVP
jgi:hypothetical protein